MKIYKPTIDRVRRITLSKGIDTEVIVDGPIKKSVSESDMMKNFVPCEEIEIDHPIYSDPVIPGNGD
jgi:hypothetical protein